MWLYGGETMIINSQRIELLLAEKDMTKADLSARCGISRQSISTITTRGTASPKNAVRLANGLGVPVEDIIKEGG